MPITFDLTDAGRISENPAFREASRDDLAVLLCLIEDGNLTDARKEAIKNAVGCSLSRLDGCIDYWKESGVVTQSGKAVRSILRTGEEIADAIRDTGGMQALIQGCESILSHTLNETELRRLVSMTEDLSLSPDYVLTLVAHYAGLSKTSVAYVEKAAVDLVNRGITTHKALEDYLREKTESGTAEATVKRIFGIYDRALSKSEREKIAKWRLYGFPEDIVGLAYDLTVAATGKASLAYADKILTGFYEAGVHTLAEAEAHIERTRAEKRNQPKPREDKTPAGGHSFDAKDFMRAALERSYGSAEKASEQEEKR